MAHTSGRTPARAAVESSKEPQGARRIDVSSAIPLPKFPSEGLALIKSSFGLVDLASISEVDGETRGFTEDIAEILPGEHTVKIRVRSGFVGAEYIGSKTLSFRARAGHSYKVEGKTKREHTFAWIVDETTGEVVAGKKS
jgi:hypothetical protein